MTPAVKALEKAGIAHEISHYDAQKAEQGYGINAAHELGLPTDSIYKTLVVETGEHGFAVAIVPVSGRLNLKKLAVALATKKTFMAEPGQVEKMTGYVLGGVSPLGQKKRLKTVIDESARTLAKIHVSGGRRGLEISLAPDDLARLTQAKYAAITDYQ